MLPPSPKEFCDSVADNELYQWKIAGYPTDALLVLKRNDIPLVIRAVLPDQSVLYEWYRPRRLRELQAMLGLGR